MSNLPTNFDITVDTRIRDLLGDDYNLARVLNTKQKILGINAKVLKGSKEYSMRIVHLLPEFNFAHLCAGSKIAKCQKSCLVNAGQGRIKTVQKRRAIKTAKYLENPETFYTQLKKECIAHIKSCKRKGQIAVFRPDGTSDTGIGFRLVTELNELGYQNDFYLVDYTKIPARMRQPRPSNYSLTLSYSGANSRYADVVMDIANETNCNVAVVFRVRKGRPLPKTFRGRRVIDGDLDDLRFLDPQGVIVGLRTKGDAYYDSTGFVVNPE